MNFALQSLRSRLPAALLSWLAFAPAYAATYNIPQALTGSPFNCTFNAGTYNCPSMSLPHHTVFNVTTPVNIRINGTFSADHHFVTSGSKITLDVAGSLFIAHQSSMTMDLNRVGGSAHISHHTSIKGDIYTGGSLQIDHQSLIDGNVDVGGDMVVGNKSVITGTCIVGGSTSYTGCGVSPPDPGLHHIRIEHTGTGVTCAPSTITIKACSGADSGGTCAPYTGGVSGIILASSGTSQELDFDIPDDSSQTTVSLGSPTPATFALSSPDTSYTCWNGTGTSCQHEIEAAGFMFTDIANHTAGTIQNSNISAVSTKGGKTCAPAFTATTPVVFRCTYNNPTIGSSIKLEFGNVATTFACGTNQTIQVPFGANGQAAFKVTYPDVGNITLSATATNMAGQDSFIAAPASFRLSTTENPIRAGKASDIKVEAMTSIANTTAPSFGHESPAEAVTLTFTRCQPNSDTPSDGAFTSTANGFSSGAPFYAIKWSEVGSGDLTARLTNNVYLGTAFAPTGKLGTGATGCATDGALKSVPHHFKTETGQLVYTYSGQPMKVIVSAHAENHDLTTNYFIPSTGTSKTVSDLTLGAWNGTQQNPGSGSWSSTSIAPAQVSNDAQRGMVSFTSTYKLGTILTPPAQATIRVNDANTTSEGFGEEAVTSIRNGRLRLSNAFGSIKQTLSIPVMAQYWSGSTWIVNTNDNYTKLPLSALALTHTGVSGSTRSVTTPTLVAGQASIAIAPPTAGTAGTVGVAMNLGATTQDNSCLASHPATVGSDQSWLRHTMGSCASPADPSATATFGVYPGQTKRTIYVREVFN